MIGTQLDVTPRFGEAINKTGRVCSKSFNINFPLLRFITVKLHLNAAQFASALDCVMSSELHLDPSNITCISRESVLVNGAACRRLQECAFVACENQLCITHALNNMESRMDFPLLKLFFQPCLELVGGRNHHRGP